MKRSFILAAVFFLSTLAVLFSSPSSSRVVKASPPDPCTKCVAKVQRDFEKCEARAGGPTQECYDGFNQGIVDCYATVCEQ
jgi:hypothetical protein